jgi:hypothetical protein
MTNTKVNNSGKTLYKVVYNGVFYGYMTAKAEREFLARQARKAN